MIIKKIFLVTLIVSLISLFTAFSEDASLMEVPTGDGKIILNSTCSFYADSFIAANPCVESISYTQDGESIGYVNVFGGIGRNFIVHEWRNYEVRAGNNCSLMLPCQGLA